MAKRYFTADIHFGEEPIRRYENSPFESPGKMDNELVLRWNGKVAAEDTVARALYVNENMSYANLFGHVHNSPLIQDYSKQHYCVSVERINYTPIVFEEIKAAILRLLSAK